MLRRRSKIDFFRSLLVELMRAPRTTEQWNYNPYPSLTILEWRAFLRRWGVSGTTGGDAGATVGIYSRRPDAMSTILHAVKIPV
jgi:hypothetical protein